MLKFAIILPVIALLLNFAGCKNKDNNSEGKIVNGRKVRASEETAVKVSVAGLSGCTATIVGPDLLLTAAHCKPNFMKDARAFFGIDLNGKGKVVSIPIAAYWVNAKYNFTAQDVESDIALLRLSKRIPEGYRPVQILKNKLKVGKKVKQVGYGLTNKASENFGTLRVSNSQVTAVSTRVIKTMDHESQGCSGDSGGPLFVKYDGKTMVAGVLSTAEVDTQKQCNGANYYTSTASKYKILLEAAKKMTGRNDPYRSLK